VPNINKVIGELQEINTTETNRTIMYSTTSTNAFGQRSTSYDTQNYTLRKYSGWVKKLSDGREQKISGTGSIDARPGHTVALATYNGLNLLEINYTTGTVFNRKNTDGFFMHLFRAFGYTLLGFFLLPIHILVSLIEFAANKHMPNVFNNSEGLPAARTANLIFGLVGLAMWATAAYYFLSEPSVEPFIWLAVGFFTLSLWLSGWIEGQSKQLISSLLIEFNNEYEAHQGKQRPAEVAQLQAVSIAG